MSRKPRTLLLIDGSHYDRLRSVFEGPFDLTKVAEVAGAASSPDLAIYYRDLRDEAEADRNRSFLDWLPRHGFEVRGRTHGRGEARERYGTNLIEVAVDALSLAEAGDAILLMASDRKLKPLLFALREKGVKVTLLSTRKASKTIAPALALVEAADAFVELALHMERLAIVRDDP